jgi:hypothetical protein
VLVTFSSLFFKKAQKTVSASDRGSAPHHQFLKKKKKPGTGWESME